MAAGRWTIFLSMVTVGCAQQAVLTQPVVLAHTHELPDTAEPAPSSAARYLVRRRGSSVKVFAFDIATGSHELVFHDFHGLLVVDRSVAGGKLTLHVDLRSVTTGSDIVTSIVKDELLQASIHPRSRLVLALQPSNDAGDYTVQGTMLLHGVERGVRFTGKMRPEGEGYRFSTVFNLSRSAFGIERTPKFDWMTFDDFRVEFDLLATPEKVTVEVVGS